MDLVSALRANETIESSIAIKAAEFLLVAGGQDPTTLAVEEAAHAIATHASGETVGPLVDWWLVTVGGGHPVGIAHLVDPDWMPAPLAGWMAECLGFATDLEGQTVAQWLQRRRGVKVARQELEGSLDPPGGKFGGATTAWEHVVEPHRKYLRELEAGRDVEPPRADFRRLMKGQPVTKGSDAYRKAKRQYDTMGKAAEELDGAVRSASGPKTGPALIPPEFDDSGMDGDLRGLVALALEAFHPSPDLAERAKAVHQSVRESLGNVTAEADEEQLPWLARLTEAWWAAEDLDDPRLVDLWDRRQALITKCTDLRSNGVDVTPVEEALSADDLSTTESLLQQIETRRHAETLAGRYRDRLTAIRNRIDKDHPGDDDLLTAVGKIENDIAAGQLEEVSQSLADLDNRLQKSDEENHERILGELWDEAKKIGATEVSVSLEGLIGSLSGMGRKPRGDDVDRYREEINQYREATNRRLQAAVTQLEGRLDQAAAGIDPSVEESIRGHLVSVRQHLDEGDLREAEADLRSAQRAAERGVFPVWEHGDGEKSLVDHVVQYLSGVGEFSDLDIRRLHVALKTKPFVVLAGLSGAGKSTIARAYAEALGATAENGRFRRVAVRPNWVDETEVLGFLSPVDGAFHPGWLTTLIRECNRQPALPFFCVLDEMNLAPVEYYLADVLSAMEDSGGPTRTPTVDLYPAGQEPTNAQEWPSEVPFPENLFLLGTVNVDETTRALSPRVLDRANVIQIGVEIGDGHHQQQEAIPVEPPWMVHMKDWQEIRTSDPDPDFHRILVRLEEAFAEMGLGLGMRSHLEIERFVSNATGVLDPDLAFDLALVQRLVPKIRGYKADLAEGLHEISELLADQNHNHTLEVIAHWNDSAVGDDEYLDGTDPKIGLWRP